MATSSTSRRSREDTKPLQNGERESGSEENQHQNTRTPIAKVSPSTGAKDESNLKSLKASKGRKREKYTKEVKRSIVETEAPTRRTSEEVENLNPNNSLEAVQSDLESIIGSKPLQSIRQKGSHTKKVIPIQSRGHHTDESPGSLDSELFPCSLSYPTSPQVCPLPPNSFPSSSRLPQHVHLSVSTLSHHSRHLRGQHPSQLTLKNPHYQPHDKTA